MSARITPEFLLSDAPRQSWRSTRRAAGFKPTTFSVKQWIGLKGLRGFALLGTTTHYCDGTRARESSSEINWFRARKKNQSNFRSSKIVGRPHRSPSALAGEAPALQLTSEMDDDFTHFEHEGWERVADRYDSVWSTVTRQFIPYLVDAAEVKGGMCVLDVACGPGYVSDAVRKAAAFPKGIDFSERMIAIAKTTFPDLFFVQGDAQNLPFEDAGFDRVLISFGLLHLSDPEKGCAEA